MGLRLTITGRRCASLAIASRLRWRRAGGAAMAIRYRTKDGDVKLMVSMMDQYVMDIRKTIDDIRGLAVLVEDVDSLDCLHRLMAFADRIETLIDEWKAYPNVHTGGGPVVS
jgi:hypothetical protein